MQNLQENVLPEVIHDTVFARKAILAFQDMFNQVEPEGVLETFKLMYESYVRGDSFSKDSITDYFAIEELLLNVISTRDLLYQQKEKKFVKLKTELS